MCVGIEEKPQYIKGKNYVDVPQMCTWAALNMGHEFFGSMRQIKCRV
jgi:hypothetical protein